MLIRISIAYTTDVNSGEEIPFGFLNCNHGHLHILHDFVDLVIYKITNVCPIGHENLCTNNRLLHGQ